MGIKTNFDTLKDEDIYSMMLFTLYKISDIPQYSTLSELVSMLDKQSLLKLCEFYGGMTIKIPTLEELRVMTYALVLYQYISIDNMEYEEALSKLECSSEELKKVKQLYCKLSAILDFYDFQARGKHA